MNDDMEEIGKDFGSFVGLGLNVKGTFLEEALLTFTIFEGT